ncbi:MAG TPA: radical SAM protein [Candidatus Angelobacter sp.]|jgi:DNA repair photolyase|nr:radical SAM protein [Candidatus Angelobacter sp.]
MPSLFPQSEPESQLVGIARLAAEGEALSQGHQVEYITLENRSLLTRCTSTRVPFYWQINPYRGCEFACKYCYARYTHEYMELRDGLDFERKIYVKKHSAWLLRQELRQVRVGQSISIGSATDPYQPAERKFGITRAIMEEFARHEGLSVGLVTKSDLILRDLDLLCAISRKNRFSVHMTITTTDTNLARILEPRAPRPDLRFKAVEKLVAAGIHTSVNCAPVLPGITDSPQELAKVVRAAAAVKARSVAAIPLFLKPCSEKIFMPFLEENFPHLVAMYKKRYADRAFLPAEYTKRISALVKRLCQQNGIVARDEESRQTASRVTLSPQLDLFKH